MRYTLTSLDLPDEIIGPFSSPEDAAQWGLDRSIPVNIHPYPHEIDLTDPDLDPDKD